MADYDPGLQVIDISNPLNPVLKATCDIKAATPGRSEGVAVAGRYAYVADQTGGLKIINLEN